MFPLTFLGTMLALTALAVGFNLLARARRRAKLSKLAAQWGMRYVGRDPFHLAAKVSAQFPLPGAADVTIIDLIYGSEPGRHRYLFTVHYTQGVVRAKNRRRRVATFSEPRDAEGAEMNEGSGVGALLLAPENLSITQQYVHLREMLAGAEVAGAVEG